MVKRICKQCGKEFDVIPFKIKEGKGKFCKKECYSKYQIGKPLSKESVRKRSETNRKKPRKTIPRICPTCNKSFLVYPCRLVSKNHAGRFCSQKCFYNSRPGITHNDGYVLLRSVGHPNAVKNYVPAHRIVMEKHLGRYLTKQEEIHHINGDRGDNRIENLMLFPDKSTHRKFHLHFCPSALL